MYPKTDVFVLCFSLVSPKSLINIRDKWIPEIKEHCPDTPYILVGMKSDLRDQYSQESSDDFVSTAQGFEMSKIIQAYDYIECSALNHQNLKDVIESSLRLFMDSVNLLHQSNSEPVSRKQDKKEICIIF